MKVEVTQSRLTVCDLTDCSLPGSSVHGILQQGYWSRWPFSSQGDLPNPGIKPKSPALQVDSLLSEPPGKPEKASHLHFSTARESWLEGNELHVE